MSFDESYSPVEDHACDVDCRETQTPGRCLSRNNVVRNHAPMGVNTIERATQIAKFPPLTLDGAEGAIFEAPPKNKSVSLLIAAFLERGSAPDSQTTRTWYDSMMPSDPATV